MKLNFTKMHGLGNDFIVINAIDQKVNLTPQQCRHLADRHFGVGCDQILLIERAREPETDFYYRIFNADGSEVGQCGNGARCFARFVRDHGLTKRNPVIVGTHSGRMTLTLENDGDVTVNMGIPVLEPARIPFQAPRREILYPLDLDSGTCRVGAVSMGNPHAVLTVPSVDRAEVDRLGPLLERHPRFPERVNVGFMEIRSPARIRLRVYERGTGETLACGSGACAAVVSGRLQGLLAERVEVGLPGGNLVVKWSGENEPVWMKGPAAQVYEGTIEL